MQPNWEELEGGYRLPYDPRPALRRLTRDSLDERAWKELWNELHHQGDVGVASYAAVPLLIEACAGGPRDTNFYGLVATIEVERHRRSNPPLPEWLHDSYRASIQRAKTLALQDLASSKDLHLTLSAMAVAAIASGLPKLAALLSFLDQDEIQAFLDDHLSWRELYELDPDRQH